MFTVESDVIKNVRSESIRPNLLQAYIIRLYVCIIVHLYQHMIRGYKKESHLKDEEISHAAEADRLCMQRMLCPMKMQFAQNADAK